MANRRDHALIVFSAILVVSLSVLAWAMDSPPAELPKPQTATTPVAPVLPAEVVAAMQEGRWGEAVAALERMAGDPKIKEVDRGYLALVRGIAERQAG
ncbi:MAG TPA: hypothetical protein VGZ22_31135, partial [Isosphaeraceae bacterium]|nr:hypothetical protein [Isosphaeraceae bacterium]